MLACGAVASPSAHAVCERTMLRRGAGSLHAAAARVHAGQGMQGRAGHAGRLRLQTRSAAAAGEGAAGDSARPARSEGAWVRPPKGQVGGLPPRRAAASQAPRMPPARTDRPVENAKLAPAAEGNRRLGEFAAGTVSPAAAAQPQSTPPGDAAGSRPRARQPGSLRDALMEYKISLPAYSPGQHRLQCPLCRGGTDGERSLAVNVCDGGDTAQWLCHRGTCGWSGGVQAVSPAPAAQRAAAPSTSADAPDALPLPLSPPPAAGKAKVSGGLPREEDLRPVSSLPSVASFFSARGISEAILERNGVAVMKTYRPGAPGLADAIVFPYRRGGVVVNCKYRAAEAKVFWQSKGGDKILYGLDDIVDSEQVIIVEGEMDKLALEAAGFLNVVSVPDGAPAQVKEGPTPPPEEDRKFSYLWNCRAHLDRVKSFVLATDADEPGQALAEELARRLGRERCFRVQWPGAPVAGAPPAPLDSVRKDANEVLIKDGADALARLVAAAEPVPIRGLFQFSDFADEIDRYYGLEMNAELRGLSTGWPNVDELYRVVPGELTIVTGVPNSGKSEWVDALMLNLADKHGWSFALCSMENKVHEHARKLIEKFVGKPFFDSSYAQGAMRMTPEDLAKGKEFLDSRFVLIRCEDDELPSMDWVLGLAKAAVMRYGIRGLMVDPYNELDHRRPSNVSETEYVSQMLTRIKRFAAHHDVHVWFVAHPRQLSMWKGEPPGLYDISGSAHFVNKCDNGLVVHRNRTDPGRAAEVRVLLEKVRNKVAGRTGETTLFYDRSNGRYSDGGLGVHLIRQETAQPEKKW